MTTTLLALILTAQEPNTQMPQHAAGTFEVKIVPQKADNPPAETAGIGRMSIDKQFQGDLTASSLGEMISLMTETKGSGVYVAVEKVTATLAGRSGSFILHHTGVMNRGVPQLSISVVPDSGTGKLTGISGTMIIKIEAGKHFYEFDYSLPAENH